MHARLEIKMGFNQKVGGVAAFRGCKN